MCQPTLVITRVKQILNALTKNFQSSFSIVKEEKSQSKKNKGQESADKIQKQLVKKS